MSLTDDFEHRSELLPSIDSGNRSISLVHVQHPGEAVFDGWSGRRLIGSRWAGDG
jgi:hypothetical protein